MATSETAQEIARRISGRVTTMSVDGRQLTAIIVDQELTEARKVLAALIGEVETESGDDQSELLIRARALWAKLRIGESNQIQEQEKSNA